jgi:hypothetical protein
MGRNDATKWSRSAQLWSMIHYLLIKAGILCPKCGC